MQFTIQCEVFFGSGLCSSLKEIDHIALHEVFDYIRGQVALVSDVIDDAALSTAFPMPRNGCSGQG